jgi:hypothetical protein
MMGLRPTFLAGPAIALAGAALADAIPLPSCPDADGATLMLFDVHQNRYVSAHRTPVAGERTTLLLDCGAGVGYEIMDDGSSPSILEADGTYSYPVFATEILDSAFRSEQAFTFAQLAGLVEAGGYEVVPLSRPVGCACSEEMLHAFD